MLFDSGCVACSAKTGPVCSDCEARLRPAPAVSVAGVDQTVAAFALDDRARHIVAALKYRRQRRLAAWFAHRVASLIPRGADALTWLPATPERRKQRGFDQAEELVRALGRETQVPAARLLVRERRDARQTGQTRAQRLQGPALSPVKACPGFVVIVDDVITTGSSIRVAAQTLRSAGAHRVIAVSMAATPSERDNCLHDLTNRCSVNKWT